GVVLHDRMARTELAGFHVGLLHGKRPTKEKQAVMQAVATGEMQWLVSTTGIEVGGDVPAAVVMVIENAERFGLSQLHQLRGRVGRGSEQSYCILVSDIKESTSRERLNVLCKTTDGFAVAERDLALRGPGDFFGKRQHGLPALAIADLMKDMRVLQSAREAANALLKDDPYLKKTENQLLRKAVNSLYASQDIVFN
ncbi:MAG TPA: ATP-dependent DNA helicase RecG, partial [Ruminococcaceae bacterium]|nr:ATP-dependent DNA helicase RecG [Oscillospiraceae bacterium]